MKPDYSLRVGLGVALLSGALIQTEVLLTRLLSVVVWYHFAFVAISVALFGLGAAALGVHFAGERLPNERTLEHMAAGAIATAGAVVLVDLALLNVSPDWFGVGGAAAFTQPTAKLLGLFVLAALPFAAGGFSIALALTRFTERVERVYFWDLAGAGIGGASVVPLLDVVGAPLALLLPASIAIGAALLFAATSRGVRRWGAAAFAIVALLGGTSGRSGLFEIRVAKGVRLDALGPELNRWNSFSMVTVLSQSGFRGWAPSPFFTGPVPEQKTLVIDMNAMTSLVRFSGDFAEVSHLSFDLSAFVYRVRPDPPRVCVIGAGGGRDVLSALAAGADHVTAVEINPLIVNDVVRGKYRDFTGNLYGRPDVSVVVEDGRSFVARSADRWDVIQLSMVDTSAATAAGAYVLTENSLYTSDAIVELARHLRHRGVLSVGSVSLADLSVGARLASIARDALERMGRDPTRGVAVLGARWSADPNAILYDVLISPDGFDEGDILRIKSHAEALAFVPVYVPGAPPLPIPGEPSQIGRILGARSPAELALARAGPLDVSPATDDRPFFFYQNRLSDLGAALVASGPAHLLGNGMAILAKLLVVTLLLAFAMALGPALVRGHEIRAGGGSAAIDASYVAALGFGFMFVEVALLQKTSIHLGHPTATLTVVLLVLLLAGGVGSALFARVVTRRRMAQVLACVVVLAIASAFGSERILSATRGLGGTGRALVAAATIVPVGLAMGAPLPLALGAISRRAGGRIAWLWAINGATSVLGSVLATLTGLSFGIRATLLAGAGFYALALILSRRVGAPDAGAAAAVDSAECQPPPATGGGPTSTAPSTP
jgi:hypothetical protein